MRVLVDVGHAAHVHLFRNMILKLKSRGHEVTVVSRRKPYVLELLAFYQIDNECLSSPGKGLFQLLCEWFIRTYRIVKLHRRQKFDVAIGTSVSISYLTMLFGVKSINVQEDDDRVVPLHVILAYPFSSLIMNPRSIKYRWFKNKRYLHDSLHEMAYLSPESFVRDEAVVKKYSLEPYGYIVVRRVALTAHHDIGAKGLTDGHILMVREVFPDLTVVSSEELKKSEVELQDMHQILAHARLVVTDSQTMTAESACLGVPAIRVSSFVGRLSYLDDLEESGLAFSCLPEDDKKYKEILAEFAREKDVIGTVRKRRALAVSRYNDLNNYLMDAVEGEL